MLNSDWAERRYVLGRIEAATESGEDHRMTGEGTTGLQVRRVLSPTQEAGRRTLARVLEVEQEP